MPKTSIQYNAEPATAELLLRIIVSVQPAQLFTEPSRIGARKLLSESKLILRKARGHLLRKVESDLVSHVPSEDVSSLTKGPLWSSRARGNLVRQHEQEFGNLPADLQLTKSCGFFMRNVSQGQFFMTIPDVHLGR